MRYSKAEQYIPADTYTKLYNALRMKFRGNTSRINLALRMFMRFLPEYNRKMGSSNLHTLECLQESNGHVVVSVLNTLFETEKSHNQAYIRRVRGALNAVLAFFSLSDACKKDRIETARSQVHNFFLQDCLPLSVRKNTSSSEYRILEQIGKNIIERDLLCSVSKKNLQDIFLFLRKVIFHGKYPPCDWKTVQSWTAEIWLDRYDSASAHHSIGMHLFRKHIRILHIIHAHIFQPDSRNTIPLMRHGAKWGTVSRNHMGYRTGTSGSSDMDTELCEQRLRLLRIVKRIRAKLVKPLLHLSSDKKSFNPDEIRGILRSAVACLERIFVLIMLTTGLRIGGFCRLKVAEGVCNFDSPGNVPKYLTTSEKNGRPRHVVLTAAVRVLLASWYNNHRSSTISSYLFPGMGRESPHVSTRYMRNICQGILQRAGVPGHCHTFRHTFVHIMFLNGASFDNIAKVLGHSCPSITSSVYGQLAQEDILQSVCSVPFLSDQESKSTSKNTWHSIAILLSDPWAFSKGDWQSVHKPHTESERKKRKRDIKEAARRHLLLTNDTLTI